MPHTKSFQALTDTLKLAVATLRDAQIPFMLGGSLAAWARGGPEPQNDLDLMVKPDHAQAALQALADAGMRTENPPEEWLFKAWGGEVMIDVIFRPSGLDITDEVLERAEQVSVMALTTPVMALEDMLVTMLYALDEHTLDYSRLLAIARSLREQIDWQQLQARAGGSPYAKAFLTLVQELGIAPPRAGTRAPASSRVRVLSSAG
ncbi:MAG: nucleotidyltransferase [Solirubrobacterales bacterium]|nr:nucleotidyltransferase [Solirubrobacterales bacterium]